MSTERRIIELDSLRGIAALLVFIFHFDLFKYGCTGVDLFFIISGFVIFMTLEHSGSIKNFWTSRLIRLYPAYWLSILIAVICFYLFGYSMQGLNWRYVLGNMLMLQPLFRTDELITAYWTLYIELTFYIGVSLVGYFKGLKNIEAILMAVVLVCFMMNWLYACQLGRASAYQHLYIVLRGLLPIITQVQFFAAGMVFYKIYYDGFNPLRITLLLLALVSTFASHALGGKALLFINVYEHLLCDCAYFAVFILLCFKQLNVLKTRLGMLTGSISYVLYLIHESFGHLLKEYFMKNVSLFIADALPMFLCLILAWLIEKYFDVPVRRWLKKKFGAPGYIPDKEI